MQSLSGAVDGRTRPLPSRLGHPSRRLAVTPRQAEILTLVACGMADKEIAERLGIAPRTIRTHLERLFRDYGLSSRSEAVAVWLRSSQHRRS